MTCQQTCASMIVCIEAVKQRNMSGDIYVSQQKNLTYNDVFMHERNVTFAFIVLLPNLKTLPTPNSVFNCMHVQQATDRTIANITEPRLSAHWCKTVADHSILL